MKKRYYITLSNKKIQVPYKIQNSKMTNYTIIDQMFPGKDGIPEHYWDFANKIMFAIKEGKPQQWEEAAFALQKAIDKTGERKFQFWINHFFDICYRLENKISGKRKIQTEINIPKGELNFIIPSDTEVKLTKRYKLERGIA